MGNKIVALENKAYGVVAVRIPVAVAEILCADGVDHKVAVGVLVKSADDIEHSCLSAARGAEDRNEIALSEGKVNSLKGVYLSASCTVYLFYIFKFKHLFLGPLQIPLQISR